LFDLDHIILEGIAKAALEALEKLLKDKYSAQALSYSITLGTCVTQWLKLMIILLLSAMEESQIEPSFQMVSSKSLLIG